MEIQYWANVAWQENANANGNLTLGQYIHVVWEVGLDLRLSYYM